MPKGYPNPKPEMKVMEGVSAVVVKAEINGDEFGPLPVVPVEAPQNQPSVVVDLDAIRAELAAELAKAKELNAKLEQKAEIRSEVSEALRLQQEEARRQAFAKMAPPVAEVMPPKPEGVALFTVKLERNYRPEGYYEVGGYLKPAVYRKKFGHDKPVMVEPEEFIPGEKAPPAVAGTGFVNKIWANTTIKLAKPEAERIVKAGIASRGFD